MDDAFVQSMKEMFGGDKNKKNLVDPFIEARFAGRKVPHVHYFSICIYILVKLDIILLSNRSKTNV